MNLTSQFESLAETLTDAEIAKVRAWWGKYAESRRVDRHAIGGLTDGMKVALTMRNNRGYNTAVTRVIHELPPKKGRQSNFYVLFQNQRCYVYGNPTVGFTSKGGGYSK